MKNSLKQTALVLAIIMILCMFKTTDFVSGNSYAFDMNELGITAGMNSEQRETEYVKRDEFAQMVVNMMQQQDVAKSLENDVYFYDMENSQYKGAVNLLAQMGYISGSGEGIFRPDDFLTYGAACKILVHALGYDKIVEDSSLNSYQYVAGAIKLTDNIDSSQAYMTFAQTMVMIDNALDIGFMIPTYYNTNIAPSYEVDEYRTFRSLLYGRNGTGIVKMRGMVTSDVSAFMYSEVPNMKETQIEIEGKLYNYKGKAPLGFVGQVVDYYLTITDYEEGEITAIEPTNKNTVYNFMGTQVTKASSGEIVFYVNDVKSQVKLDGNTRYIYNNRIDADYIMSYSKINDNVVFRTVDNDTDGIAELVYVYEYVNCVVEKVYADSNTVVFKNGYSLGAEKNIRLDEDKIYYEIYDSKGNLADFSAITEDAVVSIARSYKKDSIRIVVCTDKAEGAIIAKSDDEIVVGNTTYLCAETINLSDITIGDQVTVYLNFLGKIVCYDEIESENVYAYVYMYNSSGGLGNYKVKLLLPALISVKKVEGETDLMSGEVSTSQSLFVRNSDVVIYEAEEKIIFNGVKTNADIVLAQVLESPVAYALNENGRIFKIDTLDAVDDLRINSDPVNGTTLYNKLYNGTELIFGGKKGGSFAIKQDHTMAFCVPKYQESGQEKSNIDDDDLKVMVELKTNVGYEANGYERDENTLISDVLVVQQIMQSGQSGSVHESSDVGLVMKASRRIDVDGNERIVITMLTDGDEKNFTVSALIANQKAFESLNKGDLVAYTLDGFDQLNGVKVLQRINEYYEDQESDFICAEIKNIEYDRISDNRVRWVHNVQMGYESKTDIIQTLEILVRNPAPIFVVESEKNMRIGDISDLQIGDKIYAALNLDTIRAIVIKR